VLLACAAFAWRAVSSTVSAARGDFLGFSDFFSQWSYALFARVGDVSRIYDGEVLHQFQLTLEPALRQTFPYSYPPSYLLAIWPVGWLPYGAAYLVWDAVSLALFIWAVFGIDARSKYLWFALLAPATILCLTQGQSGLLASALIVGGLRVMQARPLLGGVLLGFATIKPQTGVLIPVALLASGQWRVIASAGFTALLLVVASGFAFGWMLWLEWWNNLAVHAAYVDHDIGNYLKPGPMANLVLFGVPLPVAHAVQAAVGIAVAAVVFVCFRRGVSDLSLAVLQIGTFLAVPYVFRYDMPMLANAILLLARDRERQRQRLGWTEAVILALGLLAPAITTLTTRFFYTSGLSLLLLFSLALWLWARDQIPSPLQDRSIPPVSTGGRAG
jgi:hypothetical protein